MDTFKSFYESVHNQQDFTRENVYRGVGIELDGNEWKHLEKYPAFFEQKLQVKQVHLDPRYRHVNDAFIKKITSLTAVCMGYGINKGYKFPKTKVIIKRLRSGETPTSAGTHSHHSQRSWSHEIEIVLDVVAPDIINVINVIAHELAHSLQTSMKRIYTPSLPEDFPVDTRWDGEWRKMISPETDYQEYREQPWEKQAVEKAKDAAKYTMQYLRSGVVSGFNPKNV